MHGIQSLRSHASSAAVSVAVTALIFVASINTVSAAPFPSAAQRHSVVLDATCAQPPAGMDLSTLSDAQLANYRLPRRPQGASAQAQWADALRHVKHIICSGRQESTHRTSQESLPNWAGNIATGGGYREVQSYWNLPCIASGGPTSASSTTWVGLDGDANDGGDGNLVQAGTDSNNDANNVPVYDMWTEDLPNGVIIASVTPNCGDGMYAQADQNYSCSNAAFEYIEDYTMGVAFPSACSDGRYASNGSTAEWITERYAQYHTGEDDPLANFDYVTFTGAQTLQNSTTLSVGQTNHNYAIMCYGGWSMCGWFSTQLAHPGSISSGGTNFTNWWDAGGGVGCPPDPSC